MSEATRLYFFAVVFLWLMVAYQVEPQTCIATGTSSHCTHCAGHNKASASIVLVGCTISLVMNGYDITEIHSAPSVVNVNPLTAAAAVTKNLC